METTILTSAFILIGLGVLVKRFPILIAGFNSLTEEEKRNVNVKGLSTFVCLSLVCMGVIALFVYYACRYVGHADWASFSLFLPLLFTPYLIWKTKRYYIHPIRGRKRIVIISFIIAAMTGMFIIYGTTPASLKIQNNKLVFTGFYGTSQLITDIVDVQLATKLPDISYRINGFSFGDIRKGWYKLREGGNCLCFLSSYDNPCLILTERTGKKIFYNTSNKLFTEMLYKELKQKIGIK